MEPCLMNGKSTSETLVLSTNERGGLRGWANSASCVPWGRVVAPLTSTSGYSNVVQSTSTISSGSIKFRSFIISSIIMIIINVLTPRHIPDVSLKVYHNNLPVKSVKQAQRLVLPSSSCSHLPEVGALLFATVDLLKQITRLGKQSSWQWSGMVNHGEWWLIIASLRYSP